MTKMSFQVKVHKIIKRRNQFVIVGPWVQHGWFNTEYNIATNFANFSWPEYGRDFAKIKEFERAFEFLLSVERIFWMEAHMTIESQNQKNVVQRSVCL